MPFKSKAQARLFYAAAKKKGGIKGLDQSTAEKFIEDTEHQKLKGLPEHKKAPKFKRVKQLMKVK